MSIKLAKLSFVIWGGSLVLYFFIYKILYNLQSLGLSAAALSMSEEMDMKDMTVFWSFPILQSSGLVALFLAYLSLLIGLVGSLYRFKGHLQTHRIIGINCFFYIVLHLFAVLNDGMGDTWRTLFIFNEWLLMGWPEGAEGYNYGIAAFYSFLILGPSYYLIKKSAMKFWRIAHYFIVAFYFLTLLHSYQIGLDIKYYSLISKIFIFLQFPLGVLFVFCTFKKTKGQ